MIRRPDSERKYHAAHDRFLKPMITNFLVHELRYLGPVTAANVADELIRIFEENTPQKDRLKHGQMLWNALDKNTRADSRNRKYKTVVLSIVTDEDIALFEKNKSIKDSPYNLDHKQTFSLFFSVFYFTYFSIFVKIILIYIYII